MDKRLKVLLREIEERIQEVENMKVKNSEKLSQLDRLKVDLDHEFTLQDLSDKQKLKKANQLQGVLKLRNKTKDEAKILEGFRSNLNVKIVSKAKTDIGQIKKGLNERKYRNRVELDIREELLREIKEVQ